MFWLKYLHSLLKTLNADDAPGEIAAGIAIGAMIGLLPKFNLLALALWLIVFFFRVHFGMATAAVLIFAIVGAVTDPLAERLGFWALTGLPALQPVWTALYNTPIVPFTAFNNTLVMGNFLLGLMLLVPVYLGSRQLVMAYRARLRERILRWRIMQALMGSKVYDLLNRWLNR